MNPPPLDFTDTLTGRHCQVSREAVIDAAIRIMRQDVPDYAHIWNELAELRLTVAIAQSELATMKAESIR